MLDYSQNRIFSNQMKKFIELFFFRNFKTNPTVKFFKDCDVKRVKSYFCISINQLKDIIEYSAELHYSVWSKRSHEPKLAMAERKQSVT